MSEPLRMKCELPRGKVLEICGQQLDSFESQVAARIASGVTHARIANKLKSSSHDVRLAVLRIYKRTGLQTPKDITANLAADYPILFSFERGGNELVFSKQLEMLKNLIQNDLTDREREILDFLKLGLKVREIADKLKTSYDGVRGSIARIEQKLGAKGLTLVAIANVIEFHDSKSQKLDPEDEPEQKELPRLHNVRIEFNLKAGERLRLCGKTMTARQSAVFVNRVAEGKEHAEIAEELGLNKSQVDGASSRLNKRVGLHGEFCQSAELAAAYPDRYAIFSDGKEIDLLKYLDDLGETLDSSLTKNQSEILAHLKTGLPIKEIARALNKSYAGILGSLRLIADKTGLSTTQLVIVMNLLEQREDRMITVPIGEVLEVSLNIPEGQALCLNGVTLNPSQSRILPRVLLGETAAEIAETLGGFTTKAIYRQRERAYKNLGFKSAFDLAVAMAEEYHEKYRTKIKNNARNGKYPLTQFMKQLHALPDDVLQALHSVKQGERFPDAAEDLGITVNQLKMRVESAYRDMGLNLVRIAFLYALSRKRLEAYHSAPA